TVDEPPAVPDVLLSLDITWSGDLRYKEYQTYFRWIVGKFPDVVIEIVSNRTGGEDGFKKLKYASWQIPYYVVYDPRNLLRKGTLRAYEWVQGEYRLLDTPWLEGVNLGLVEWKGRYEGVPGQWLRWCDKRGRVLETGEEARDRERQ